MTALHLLFTHRGVRYALLAAEVCEIAWVPELAELADSSPWVIGAFNQHGHLVPVLDLALCFDHERSVLCATDAVIVVKLGDERFGLLAQTVDDAVHIAAETIEPVPADHELLGHAAPRLLQGVAMLGADLAMLLDLSALLETAASARGCTPRQTAAAITSSVADSEVRHERARRMALPVEMEGATADEHFALISINDEPFGVPVRAVREFTKLGRVWPVPCCPPHILGSINLHGDILTVIDLRPVLGLPALQAPVELVVLSAGTLCFGLAVAAVRDVAPATRLAPLPATGERREWPFCRGTARAQDVVFSIIDIEAMLAARVLHIGHIAGSNHPEPAIAGAQTKEIS